MRFFKKYLCKQSENKFCSINIGKKGKENFPVEKEFLQDNFHILQKIKFFRLQSEDFEQLFKDKAKNKTAAVTIGQDGNLTYPKTFNYHGDTIENICNSENIAKVPSYVEQLATSFSNNPGLFITLLKQDKYPTDSLECVKDYIKENEEIKKYAVAIDEFEKSRQITDRNAIKQLNFFVKDLSCLGMSPETVMRSPKKSFRIATTST